MPRYLCLTVRIGCNLSPVTVTYDYRASFTANNAFRKSVATGNAAAAQLDRSVDYKVHTCPGLNNDRRWPTRRTCVFSRGIIIFITALLKSQAVLRKGRYQKVIHARDIAVGYERRDSEPCCWSFHLYRRFQLPAFAAREADNAGKTE